MSPIYAHKDGEKVEIEPHGLDLIVANYQGEYKVIWAHPGFAPYTGLSTNPVRHPLGIEIWDNKIFLSSWGGTITTYGADVYAHDFDGDRVTSSDFTLPDATSQKLVHDNSNRLWSIAWENNTHIARCYDTFTLLNVRRDSNCDYTFAVGTTNTNSSFTYGDNEIWTYDSDANLVRAYRYFPLPISPASTFNYAQQQTVSIGGSSYDVGTPGCIAFHDDHIFLGRDASESGTSNRAVTIQKFTTSGTYVSQQAITQTALNIITNIGDAVIHNDRMYFVNTLLPRVISIELQLFSSCMTKCSHHWKISSPSGIQSQGVCKHCNETRTFYNSVYFTNLQNNDVKFDEKGKRKSVRGVDEETYQQIIEEYRLPDSSYRTLARKYNLSIWKIGQILSGEPKKSH